MLPKSLTSGGRYLGSSAYNCYISFLDPNQGQGADGTPNAPVVVASGIHADVQEWRGKEVDKPQTRIGQSSYRMVVHYPKTYTINTGMLIQFRNQTHQIESISDPDGQQFELHIWTWINNDSVGTNG